jgi:predicted nucleic acid-binding protein
MLPASGLVYADANSVIYSVESQAVYWSLMQPLWQAARVGSITVVSSELLVLETLVGPLRQGDKVLLTAYEQLFQSPDMSLLPIDQASLREAAALRAKYSKLRSPDAIHAATALLSGCKLFITNDLVFRTISGLPIVVLDDLLGP